MATNDFFEFRHFTIDQRHAGMKVGTDSDLLGTLAEGGHDILDIGTGTGILSLMMAQRFPEAHITAVEIDDNAVMDASANFASSPYAHRIQFVHASFQDYLRQTSSGQLYDCIICNPPYFDKSLENKDLSRLRARHTSSLPFAVLIEGAYSLLKENGVFSVCIPPEVLSDFTSQCLIEGFWLKSIYRIKSIPEKAPKRFVLVHKKGRVLDKLDQTYCMRNSDKTRSDWYIELMKEFHLNSSSKDLL